MIQFKEFLLEARDAPLYHGTPLENAYEILKANEISGKTEHYTHLTVNDLKKSWNGYNREKGVSLSRVKASSEYFASRGVVFELDQRKLRQNFKITPINFYNTGSRQYYKDGNPTRFNFHAAENIPKADSNNEFEEFLRGPLKNLSKYLIKIHINKNGWDKLQEHLHEWPELAYHPKLFYDGKFVNEY